MEELYGSAARGDVNALCQLLENDTFLLDRVSYTSPNNTPLHVATMKGHLPFAKEILKLNPDLAGGLNSQQMSPLHVASARGHVEIAMSLFEAAPHMCLSHDSQGQNPLHLAAIKGCVPLLEELVRRAPLAAREKVDRGHTVLHLCVKHGQLEALKVLVKEVNELINAKNDDGDTILHMAVVGKKKEIVDYLFKNTSINVNATNSNGQTAKAIFDQSQPELTDTVIRRLVCNGLTKSKSKSKSKFRHSNSQPVKWLTKKRDTIMVVAILIATMAFQAGVTPPGGVWQDDFTHYPNGTPRHHQSTQSRGGCDGAQPPSSIQELHALQRSGIRFISQHHPAAHQRSLFMWILMVIMWLTVTSIAVTYAISIVVVTPNKDKKSLSHVIEISLAVWCSVMGILLVGNTIRLINRWLKNRGVVVWRPKRFRNLVEVNHEMLDKKLSESIRQEFCFL